MSSDVCDKAVFGQSWGGVLNPRCLARDDADAPLREGGIHGDSRRKAIHQQSPLRLTEYSQASSEVKMLALCLRASESLCWKQGRTGQLGECANEQIAIGH